METAQKIFVLYGTFSVTFGMLLGLPLTSRRMTSPTAPRHLVVAHLSALMQGSVHLGFAFALTLSTLTPWLETSAAVLMVCGSSLFVAGTTLNWRQGVGDHFAERSPGWYLLSASGAPHIVGACIVFVGAISATLA